MSTNNRSRRNRYTIEIVKGNWAHDAANAAAARLRRDRTHKQKAPLSYGLTGKSRQLQAIGCCSVSRSKARACIEESLLFSDSISEASGLPGPRYRNSLSSVRVILQRLHIKYCKLFAHVLLFIGPQLSIV